MSSVQSITLAPGVVVGPADDDPLVVQLSAVSREMLREGIRQLGSVERDVLRLVTREHLTVDAAAAQLRIDVEHVEMSLRTGLRSLRQSLLAQLGERSS